MQSHINILTNRPYSGKNFVELEQAKQRFNYSENVWGTFKQFQSKGKKIKAGQHASAHVFQGFGTFQERNAKGEIIEVQRPLGFAPVFNVEQTAEWKHNIVEDEFLINA